MYLAPAVPRKVIVLGNSANKQIITKKYVKIVTKRMTSQKCLKAIETAAVHIIVILRDGNDRRISETLRFSQGDRIVT